MSLARYAQELYNLTSSFRPLSKTVKFNTLKVTKGAASKKSFTKF